MTAKPMQSLMLALALSGATMPIIAEEGPVLEEVLVTAQGRTESIQDTPLSINAIQGDKLTTSRMNRLEDLVDFVPNLSLTQTGLSTQIYVRGIGTGNNQGFEQSVPQFVDGVFYGRQQLLRAPFYDLDRVEVLRGPQPILFGKNAVAGAISIATAKPRFEDEIQIYTAYEFEQEGREIQLIGNKALSDSLAARIALRSFDDDGYVDNDFLGGSEPVRDEFSVRASFEWAASDNLTANFKFERDTFDVEGRQVEIVRDVGAPNTFATTLSNFGFPNSIGETDLNYQRSGNADEFSRNELTNYTLKLEYDLNGYSITSTTAKVAYEFDEVCECDFVAAPILTAALFEDYQQTSQEFRIVSPAGDRFNWLAGIFYQSSELDFDESIGFTPGGVAAAIPPFAILSGIDVARQFDQDSDVAAVFGQMSFDVSERLHATLGLRYTDESKDAARELDAVENATGQPTTNPGVGATLQGGLAIFTNQGPTPNSLKASRDEEKLSGSINIEFDASDDTLLYASATKGFKSGGFDARSNTPTGFEFEEEEAIAYELGVKTTLFDGRMELNGAVYRTEYEDLQISQFDGVLGFNVGNAKETVVQGIEVDGRIGLTNNLTVNYSAAYLDHEYTDYRNGNCYFAQPKDGDTVDGVTLCDYTGKSGQYTPEYSASLGFEYLLPLGSSKDLRFALDVNWVDEQNVHQNLAPEGEQDAYAIVDFGVFLEADDWRFGVLVKNATDEEIITYQGNTPLSERLGADTHYAFIGQPRTVTVQASKTFREF